MPFQSETRVVVITQEDHFAIPENIEKLIRPDGVRIVRIVTLDVRGSLVNKKSYFFRGFGFVQGCRMAFRVFKKKLAAGMDLLCKGRLPIKKQSVKLVAQKYKIPHEVCSDPNEAGFLKRIKEENPDIIVSFSAPVVFKEELLSIPAKGCINLHCSYLPDYAGLLPSFWVLYNGEKETGATVHYMDTQIDNGGILEQVRVPIEKGQSMFDLIIKTKAVGGDLMCRVIKKMAAGEDVELQPNPSEKGDYYSWPSVEQMMEFRRQGGRFI
ncbi:MAG: hypothetical protein K9J79_12335 [Desulfobacteraceae bacterium]|nr:hypothetical protein [Desulfobacteraceae bacterium]